MKLKKVDLDYLSIRKKRLIKGKFAVSKWIQFCEYCLLIGLKVKLYEAKNTRSKYVYLYKDDKKFKLRFSNHKPSFKKEEQLDSDFYVGVSNGKVQTTVDAIIKIRNFFNIENEILEFNERVR